MKYLFIAALLITACSNPKTPTNTTETAELAATSPTFIADTIFLGGVFKVNFTVQSGTTLSIPMNTRKMQADACYKGLTLYILNLTKGAKISCEGVCYPYGVEVKTNEITKTWFWFRQYIDPPVDWRPITISPNYVKDLTFKVTNTGNKPASFTFSPSDAPATGTGCK